MIEKKSLQWEILRCTDIKIMYPLPKDTYLSEKAILERKERLNMVKHILYMYAYM